MSNKTEGTGLLDDNGNIVKEIKDFDKMVDRNAEQVLSRTTSPLARGIIQGLAGVIKKHPEAMNDNCYTQTVDFTNYQNDGMGCPTGDLNTNCNLEELLEAYVKADKIICDIIADGPSRIAEEIEKQRAKLKRVK